MKNTPRTHKPEVNRKIQEDTRQRKRRCGLVPMQLWILPKHKTAAKNLEIKSQVEANWISSSRKK